MPHLQLTTLEKDGWELLTNEKPLSPQVGDLCKITISSVSPLDFEKTEPIRSVLHHDLWVEISAVQGKGFLGSLKSKLENTIPFKDGSKFELGDQIYFETRHLQAIRPTSSQTQSPSA